MSLSKKKSKKLMSNKNRQNVDYLLKLINKSEEDIKNGDIINQDEMFTNLESKLFKD